MDKAIEKINKLLSQKEIWEQRLEQFKNEYTIFEEESKKLNIKIKHLLYEQYDLKEEKKDLIVRNQKIADEEKKSKIKFWAMFIIMNICVLLLLFTIGKPLISVFILVAFNLLFTPSFSILSGIEDCKAEREYLKKNTIENTDEKILRNKKNIKLQKEKISFNNNKLNILKENICQIENFIEIFEERIEEIHDIRQSIIIDFITQNNELDNLINSNYIEYEKQNQLVKK